MKYAETSTQKLSTAVQESSWAWLSYGAHETITIARRCAKLLHWDLFVIINIPPVREAFFRDFASQGRKTTLCRVSRVTKQLSRIKGSIHAWPFLALIQVLIYLF